MIDNKKRRRSRRVIITAVLVLVLLAAVTFAALTWTSGRRDTASAPPAAPDGAPPPASSPAPAASGSSIDGRVSFDGLTWVTVHGMALPVSARSGPTRHEGGRAERFGHDQAGALLAAAHLMVRCDAVVGPSVYQPTIREQVVGVDAAALARAVDADYDRRRLAAGVDDGQPLPDAHSELAGYRIESYDDTRAFLRLLIASPGPDAQGTVLVDFRVEMRWADGDWRLVAPPDGQWRHSAGQATSRNGYTPFPRR